MSDAELLVESPDEELAAVIADLPRVSAASESEARHDRVCADGSTVVVTSREGGDVDLRTTAPEPVEG